MIDQSEINSAVPQAEPTEDEPRYAIVEIFGHRTHAGRVFEVEQYGTKMLRVDVPNHGDFANGHVTHFYGGGSIFSLTPTDLATVERINRFNVLPGTYLPKPDDGDHPTEEQDWL